MQQHYLTSKSKGFSCILQLCIQWSMILGPLQKAICNDHHHLALKNSLSLCLVSPQSAVKFSFRLCGLRRVAPRNSWLHSGFLPQFLFRFETSNVHFMSRKTDISQGPIDHLASKKIFLSALFVIFNQFWCQIINWPLQNISFATHEMNAWCFEAKQKMWKKSPVQNPIW